MMPTRIYFNFLKMSSILGIKYRWPLEVQEGFLNAFRPLLHSVFNVSVINL